MSRRKKTKGNSGSGGGSWMTTFSDLMSLLLTFFILLFSMSNVSNEKFTQAAQCLSSSLIGGGEGIMDGVIVPFEDDNTGTNETVVPAEELEAPGLDPALIEIYNRVINFVEKNDLEDKVIITADPKGVYVNVSNAILFGKESASISREGRSVLKSVGKLLNQLDNRVVIEGHTDDIPNAYGQYPTNWELSVGRAVSVLRYLNENEHVDTRRLSVVGYGENQPLAPNNSEENRARNRRVNIVVIYEPEG
ncbi:flagellar motor protein MotB [Jeotgalibaca porci]|uniref:OmpA/MotB family protein n=1 Tax=Jeotgalibaca porci TaxID=1868793 RepID=UPI0035A05FBE